MRRSLGYAASLLTTIEAALAGLSATMAVAIMLIIVCDVVLRYLFRSPLTWSTELVGWYLMVIVFFGTVSAAFSRDTHIRVDIVRNQAPLWLQRLFEIAICLGAALVFGLIAKFAADRAWESYVGGEVMSGVIAWPTWPPPAIVAIGSALTAVRLLVNAAAHITRTLGGPDIVALPVASGHDPEGIAE